MMTDCISIQGSTTSSSSDVMTLTTAASSWCAIPTNSRIRVIRLTRPHHIRRLLVVTAGPETKPSFGFSVRGGKEFGTGFFISDIERNSEADLKGLRVGDQVLRINGFRVDDAVHKEFIQFVSTQDRLTLKVRGVGMLPIKDKENDRLSWNVVKTSSISSTPSESSYKTIATERSIGVVSHGRSVDSSSKDINIVLNVAPRTKLGLGICKGPEWKPGIFVQFTKDKSVAREAGLRPGDQILSVNSIDFSDVLFSEAVAVMKSTNKLDMMVRTAAGCDLFPGESSGYNSSASSVTGDQSPCWADAKSKRLTAVCEEPAATGPCWNEGLYAAAGRSNKRNAESNEACGGQPHKEVNKTIIKLSENGTSINNTYIANPHLITAAGGNRNLSQAAATAAIKVKTVHEDYGDSGKATIPPPPPPLSFYGHMEQVAKGQAALQKHANNCSNHATIFADNRNNDETIKRRPSNNNAAIQQKSKSQSASLTSAATASASGTTAAITLGHSLKSPVTALKSINQLKPTVSSGLYCNSNFNHYANSNHYANNSNTTSTNNTNSKNPNNNNNNCINCNNSHNDSINCCLNQDKDNERNMCNGHGAIGVATSAAAVSAVNVVANSSITSPVGRQQQGNGGSSLSSAITEELKKRKEKLRAVNSNSNNNNNNHNNNQQHADSNYSHENSYNNNNNNNENGVNLNNSDDGIVQSQPSVKTILRQHQQQQHQQQQQQHNTQFAVMSPTTIPQPPPISPTKRTISARAASFGSINCMERNNSSNNNQNSGGNNISNGGINGTNIINNNNNNSNGSGILTGSFANTSTDQHSALMDEFKRAHQRMFKNGFQESERNKANMNNNDNNYNNNDDDSNSNNNNNHQERQEALKHTAIMEDDISHRATTTTLSPSAAAATTPITSATTTPTTRTNNLSNNHHHLHHNYNEKPISNDCLDAITGHRFQNSQQQQQLQQVIPPPPPQFANQNHVNNNNNINGHHNITSGRTTTTTTSSSSSKYQSNGNIKGNSVKQNSRQMLSPTKPPSSPIPDYDSIEVKRSLSTKQTVRLGAVTIGEYEPSSNNHQHHHHHHQQQQQRKEPGKFDFINRQKSTNGGVGAGGIYINENTTTITTTTTLHGELQNTLARSKLKQTSNGNTNGHHHHHGHYNAVEHKRDCPLRNGYLVSGNEDNTKTINGSGGGGVDQITRKLQGTNMNRSNGQAATRNGTTGILKNGNNSRNSNGTSGNYNGGGAKVAEKTITFGN